MKEIAQQNSYRQAEKATKVMKISMFNNALAKVAADLNPPPPSSPNVYCFNPNSSKPPPSSRNQTMDVATPRIQVEHRISTDEKS